MYPTRIDLRPAPVVSPKPCPTCRAGCPCDPTKGQSCGHYGCWGRDATSDCPGIAYELAREQAHRARWDRLRQQEADRAARHRAGYEHAILRHLNRRP